MATKIAVSASPRLGGNGRRQTRLVWLGKSAKQKSGERSRAGTCIPGGECVYKKVSEWCSSTIPAGTAQERPLSVTRFSSTFFASARCPPDGGLCLCYIRDEARSIRQRSASSAKTTRRLMRPAPSTHDGSLRRAGRGEGNRVTRRLYPGMH